MELPKIIQEYQNSALSDYYEHHKPVHLVYQDDDLWIWSDERGLVLWFQLPGDMVTPFNGDHLPTAVGTQNITFVSFDLPDGKPTIRCQIFPKETSTTITTPLTINMGVMTWMVKHFSKKDGVPCPL